MSIIRIKKLSAFLDQSKPDNLTTELFIEYHSTTEAYFRRLLYLPLRINGENDANSNKMTSSCKLNSIEILEKAIKFIANKRNAKTVNSEFTFSALRNNYQKLYDFFRYFKNFASRHRNKYLHGIFLLKLLMKP